MPAPNRPPPRLLQVLDKRAVTPNMLRLTIGGAGMAGFPAASQGGYLKLRLHPDGPDAKVVVRTYTIRHQRADAMDVDFVLHEDAHGVHGPATHWAMTAAIGDTIEIAGPGLAKPLFRDAAYHLIAGDMTALPAISVNLEALGPDARGHAVIEVQSDADAQDFALPPGVTLEYVVNPVPGTGAAAMLERVRAAFPEDNAEGVHGWVASEFATMRTLRDYLRAERGLGADRLYISSYWKSGLDEEAHKIVKREDSEQAAA